MEVTASSDWRWSKWGCEQMRLVTFCSSLAVLVVVSTVAWCGKSLCFFFFSLSYFSPPSTSHMINVDLLLILVNDSLLYYHKSGLPGSDTLLCWFANRQDTIPSSLHQRLAPCQQLANHNCNVDEGTQTTVCCRSGFLSFFLFFFVY